MPTIGQTWRQIQAQLESVHLQPAPREGQFILAHALGLSWSDLLQRESDPLPSLTHLDKLLANRLTGAPLAYVLGGTWVADRWWKCTPCVLIPRPDTEILILEAEKRLQPNQTIAEVGIGSGVILGTLGANHPDKNLTLYGTDLSLPALTLANANLTQYNVQATLLHTSLLTGLPNELDMVISNPPYISAAEYQALEPSVQAHEPALALTSGPTGLEIYQQLIPQAAAHLRSGGWLGLEIGWNQSQSVLSLFQEKDWQTPCIIPDLAQRPRNIWAQKR